MTNQPSRRPNAGPHERNYRNYAPSRYDAMAPTAENDSDYVRACLKAGGFPWKELAR